MTRCVLLFLALMLAGCATPSGAPAGGAAGAGANPHYKVGASYRINGRTYHPREDTKYDAVGVASWYGDQFQGRPTANGEIFDKNRLSAAHTTLPLPSLVEVENLENGRRVVVRVNDRGPFVGDRLIDLSHGAARALDFESKGLARVRVRYLGRAELAALAPVYGAPAPRRGRPAAPLPQPVIVARAPAEPVIIASQPEIGSRAAADRRAVIAATPASADADIMAQFIDGALAAPAGASAYWIAVSDYGDLNDLEAARLGLTGVDDIRVVSETDAGGEMQYGLQIGPFADPAAAEARLAVLREAGYPDAWIESDACAPATDAACR